jgi:signal transduction histidine kinase
MRFVLREDKGGFDWKPDGILYPLDEVSSLVRQRYAVKFDKREPHYEDRDTAFGRPAAKDCAVRETAEEVSLDLAAVGRIACISDILKVVCATTGMGFAGVARVSESSWTACAVEDRIELGLKPGGQLDISTTLCLEARNVRAPVVIDHASMDSVYATHHTPRIYGIESYISVPIVLKDDAYFGNLFAVDRAPSTPSRPEIVSMFQLFANLIAMHLDEERTRLTHARQLLAEVAAGETREHFVAVLGHDLRTPLSAVSSTAMLIRRISVDQRVVELAQRIEMSSSRMALLIDDMLDLARGKFGGGLVVHAADVEDLGQALRDVVEELRCVHPDRKMNAQIHVEKGIRCDRSRIQQLASNLLSNALLHGSPAATVELSAQSNAGELVLTVTNQGEPIAPEDLDHIFKPFWRSSQLRAGAGLGLGLYICAEIVRAHGGTLEVASSASSGTTFVALLPGLPSAQAPSIEGAKVDR